MNDLMREEFEKEWGFTSEEQGLRFVQELNIYGCDLYLNSGVADRKSSAWFYFQKGWKASRESLVVELPAENPLGKRSGDCEGGLPSFEQQCAAECNFVIRDCREAIHAAGVKTK